MKTLQILAVLAASLFAYSASALTIQVTSAVDGGFDRAVPGSFSGAALDGTTASSFDETIFQNITTGNNAGRNIYKVGHFNSSNANYWGANSQLAQAFTFTVSDIGTAPTGSATGPAPRYRMYRSNPGSATQYYYKPWLALEVGTTTTTLGAQSNDRQIGIQFEGTGIAFTDFSHTYGSTTDSISVVAPVPEPSTYALLAGFAAFLFVAIKRRK